MDRRHLLSVIGSGSVLLVAGCIDVDLGFSGSSAEPEGMDISTLYVQADVFTGESRHGKNPYFDWQEEDHTIISDAETVEGELIDDEEVATFLEETDFADSYLLIVRNGMQSQMELTLDRIERTTGGLDVYISITGPERPDDDLTTHSLLMRITDEEDGPPDEVSVPIEGYR